jgi:hypothetical protein
MTAGYLTGATRKLSSNGVFGRWMISMVLPATRWQPVHAADNPS